MTTKTFDIPYSGHFQVEEIWKIKSEGADKIKVTLCFKVVFFKSCMFESKIRSKTGESLKRDHEMWFANIKEKKFIPEPLRKALSVHETEVANEVEFKKQESEIQEDIRDVFRPVTVNKKVQEKMEAEMKSFRFIAKLTIILLVFTLFLFFFTYLMMLRKIITLEGRVDSLTSHLAHLLSHHIHNSTDIRVEEVLEL